MNQLQKTTNQITRILLEGLGKIEFQHLLHAFSHHPTALVSQRTCPLPGVIPVVTAGCVVLFQRLSHIWQTLVRLNECCIRRREHPHILEVDCAVCTFLTIVHGIKKKNEQRGKKPQNNTPRTNKSSRWTGQKLQLQNVFADLFSCNNFVLFSRGELVTRSCALAEANHFSCWWRHLKTNPSNCWSYKANVGIWKQTRAVLNHLWAQDMKSSSEIKTLHSPGGWGGVGGGTSLFVLVQVGDTPRWQWQDTAMMQSGL